MNLYKQEGNRVFIEFQSKLEIAQNIAKLSELLAKQLEYDFGFYETAITLEEGEKFYPGAVTYIVKEN